MQTKNRAMRVYALILVIVSSVGCSTRLTSAGSNIKLITEHQRNQCESLGVITGYSSTGFTPGSNAQNAVNDARNKASKLGGNGLYIVNVSTLESSSTVIGEVFKCDFMANRSQLKARD
ncbi:DUF4156 domain-containing protein [uncultured Shewanella sp.]|uniref:DUF4156 domain-containing protein n=1 Tax=uncultured Shewanella sp. TaxID=173975 RepID=UPI002615A7E2|nr:DUF4156 domain-containing protein [uncultured Shewanella sp.]